MMNEEEDVVVKWEYDNYAWDGKNGSWSSTMKKYGDEGWEAYSVVFSGGTWEVFFKRPKRD